MNRATGDVTRLLRRLAGGDKVVLDELIVLVHSELRQLAHARMRGETPGGMLQTTALVNEAYIRLVDQRVLKFKDRKHFFSIAARVMRRIVVDEARARRAAKRGGGCTHEPLEEGLLRADYDVEMLLTLDAALDQLEQRHPRAAELFLLRFFVGFTVEEIAKMLGFHESTVKRDSRYAQLILRRRLRATA